MKAYGKGAIAAVAALALAMTGCQGKTDSKSDKSGMTSRSAQAQYNPQPRDNIKDGGTLTTAIVEIPEQMNAWQSNMNAYTSTLWGWYNPQLTYYTPEGELKVNNAYLTEMPKVEKSNGFKVIYHINPKAKYNNGEPIDWKSFEAAWKACGEVTEESTKAYECNSTDGYKEIKSVTKGANDQEVVVEFKAPYAWWMGLFGTVLNPHALDPQVFAEGYTGGNFHPEWGAGPFKIEKIDVDAKIATFVRNENWWGDAPKLEKRIFKQMESSASINAFKNGEIDGTGVSTAERLAQIEGMKEITINRGATPFTSLVTLNATSEKLKDIKVREGIFRGINRKALAKIRFEGLNYTEELPGSLQMYAFQKGYQDNYGAIMGYDTAKAKQLLDEAGWKVGADGIRANAAGVKLSLKIPVFGDNPTTKNLVQAMQTMMKDINVELVYDQRPSTDFSKVLKNRDFDFLMSGFSASDPYGMAYICQTYCSDSTLNKSKTADKAYDATIKDLQKIDDPDKQIAEGNKVEQKALAQYGLMPLFNGPEITAVKAKLANFGSSVFFVAPPENIGWQK